MQKRRQEKADARKNQDNLGDTSDEDDEVFLHTPSRVPTMSSNKPSSVVFGQDAGPAFTLTRGAEPLDTNPAKLVEEIAANLSQIFNPNTSGYDPKQAAEIATQQLTSHLQAVSVH